MTSSGIQPVTAGAECLNQLRYRISRASIYNLLQNIQIIFLFITIIIIILCWSDLILSVTKKSLHEFHT
jgi:hypothetical protein